MPKWGRSTVNGRAEVVTSSSPLLFQSQVRTRVLASMCLKYRLAKYVLASHRVRSTRARNWGRFSIRVLVRARVLVDSWNVISRCPSTVPIRSTHQASTVVKPGSVLDACSISPFHRACIGGGSCVLAIAINPRMHFALAAVRWRTIWRRRTTVA